MIFCGWNLPKYLAWRRLYSIFVCVLCISIIQSSTWSNFQGWDSLKPLVWDSDAVSRVMKTFYPLHYSQLTFLSTAWSWMQRFHKIQARPMRSSITRATWQWERSFYTRPHASSNWLISPSMSNFVTIIVTAQNVVGQQVTLNPTAVVHSSAGEHAQWEILDISAVSGEEEDGVDDNMSLVATFIGIRLATATIVLRPEHHPSPLHPWVDWSRVLYDSVEKRRACLRVVSQ